MDLYQGFSSRGAIFIIQCLSSMVPCELCIVNIYQVDTLQDTFIGQSSWNLVWIFVLIKSQMCLNLGHVWSWTRSLDQIKEIPCGHSCAKPNVLNCVMFWIEENYDMQPNWRNLSSKGMKKYRKRENVPVTMIFPFFKADVEFPKGVFSQVAN